MLLLEYYAGDIKEVNKKVTDSTSFKLSLRSWTVQLAAEPCCLQSRMQTWPAQEGYRTSRDMDDSSKTSSDHFSPGLSPKRISKINIIKMEFIIAPKG